MKGRISKAFGENTVFKDFSFGFEKGEVTCVLGASGVGKTTLLRILAGLTDYEGEIYENEGKAAFAFQQPRLIGHMTAADNLRYVGVAEEEIDGVLQKAEILPLKERIAATLSGGEKQRLALARAFGVHAERLFLDEAFSSLDTALKIRLWQTFARFWEEEKPTAVLVTHDLEEAWALGHRIVLLKDGKIALDIRPNRETYPTPYLQASPQKAELLAVLMENETDNEKRLRQ